MSAGAAATLVALTGLALIFSMGAVLAVVVVHHNQQKAYDLAACQACPQLREELARQAKALSRLWREVEAVDGRRAEVSGSGVCQDLRV